MQPQIVSEPRWTWWAAGIVVVPLCANLLIGIPYDILADRDLQLHGKATTAEVVSAKDIRTKTGWSRLFEYRYSTDAASRTVWLGGRPGTKVGAKVRLVYAPSFPAHARVGPPSQPWDTNIAWRLAISFTLAIIFGGTWLFGFRASRQPRITGPNNGAGPD